MNEVIGFEFFNYTSKKTGKVTPACRIYVQFVSEKITGLGCEAVFAPVSVLGGYTPAVGDSVRVIYNRFGSVEAIEKLDA